MADNTIRQRITLDGAQDVAQQLGAIGAAATGAFAPIQRAVAELESRLASIGKVVGVFTAVGGALLALAKSSSAATVEVSHLAEQSGVSISEMSGMGVALTNFGAKTDDLSTVFKRLSVAISTTWPEIQASVKNAASTIIADQQAIVKSTLGVESAQIALFNAQQKLGNLRGIATDPEIAAATEAKAAILAVAEAEARLAEAIQKRAEAVKKASDDQKNDLVNVAAVVKSVTDGITSFQDAATKANLNLDNVIKGLIINAGPAVEQLGAFRGSLQDLGNAAPNVQQVFFKLADFMKNSGDAALNTAVAFKLFGRGVKQDLIEAMTKGSAAIQAEIDRLKSLGLVLTEFDKGAAKGLEKSFNSFANVLSITNTQIGNRFSPAFTEGIKILTAALEKSHGTILAWAEDIANRVAPVIRDFFRVLAGESQFETPALQSFIDGVKSLGPLATAAASAVISAFKLIGVAVAVAAAVSAGMLNDLFGKDFTGPLEIGVAALIVKFGGLAGAVVVLGIAFDRLTDGVLTRFLENVVGVLDRTIQRIGLLKQLATGNINFDQWLEANKKLEQQATAGFQRIFDGSKKASDGIVADMQKAKDEVAKVFDGLQQDTSAKTAAVNVRGIGDAARAAIPGVSALASSIKLLDANKGFNQESAGGTIQVIDTKQDLFKPPPGSTIAIRDSANSFGELGKKVNEARENVDRLDQEMGQLDLSPPPMDAAWENIQKSFAETKAKIEAGLKEISQQKIEPSSTGEIFNSLLAEISQLPSKIGSALNSVGEFLLSPFAGAADAINGAWQRVIEFFTGLPATIGGAMSGVTDSLVQPFQQAATAIESIVSQIVASAQRAAEALRQAGSSGNFGGNIGSPFARGGHVFGAGTETSDSIPAWLSHNEFVVRALQVRNLGHGFMHFINRSGVTLADIYERFFAGRKFAIGGLVDWASRPPALPKLPKLSGMLEWTAAALRLPSAPRVGGTIDWRAQFPAVPRFSTGGMVDWLSRHADMPPKTMLRGAIDWATGKPQWPAIPKFAAGGIVDWLSREHAIKSPATALRGVLDWTNGTLRLPAIGKFSMGGLIDSVAMLKGMQLPKFSLGGLADSLNHSFEMLLPPMPRFAEGGLVPVAAGPSGRPIVLDFGDGNVVAATTSDHGIRLVYQEANKRKRRALGRRQSAIG